MIRISALSALAVALSIVACSSSSTDASGTNSSNNNGSQNNGGNTNGSSTNGSSSNNTGNTGNTTDGGSMMSTTDAGGGGTDSGPPGCGSPGDTGNDFGVGKYCTSITDCIGNNKANLCATLGGDPTQTFCTTMCKDQDAGASECGMDATCECQGGQCGCYPNKCL